MSWNIRRRLVFIFLTTMILGYIHHYINSRANVIDQEWEITVNRAKARLYRKADGLIGFCTTCLLIYGHVRSLPDERSILAPVDQDPKFGPILKVAKQPMRSPRRWVETKWSSRYLVLFVDVVAPWRCCEKIWSSRSVIVRLICLRRPSSVNWCCFRSR